MKETFGLNSAGGEILRFTLKNSNSASVSIINYGATITSIRTPDREGVIGEITLGFDTCKEWLDNIPYFGVICGRYCNRISHAQFSLDGINYQLTVNDGKHNLHGGIDGFNKRTWMVERYGTNFVELSIESPDGDQGFPGCIRLVVRYELTNANELIINYYAKTDKPTVAAFTAHPYFNLRDGGQSTILQHRLQIAADQYLPVNGELIPYGELETVVATPFDFREAKAVGCDLQVDNEQLLQAGSGYDHCWVVRGARGELRTALTLIDDYSGRMLEVLTTEPGVQVYTGSFLDGTTGRNGLKYSNFAGMAIEAEPYPDSPNQSEFPSVTLMPGEEYRQTTIYRFSVATNESDN